MPYLGSVGRKRPDSEYGINFFNTMNYKRLKELSEQCEIINEVQSIRFDELEDVVVLISTPQKAYRIEVDSTEGTKLIYEAILADMNRKTTEISQIAASR